MMAKGLSKLVFVVVTHGVAKYTCEVYFLRVITYKVEVNY